MQIRDRFCGGWPYGCTDSTRVEVEGVEKTNRGRQVEFRVVDGDDRSAKLASAYFELDDDVWRFLFFENPFKARDELLVLQKKISRLRDKNSSGQTVSEMFLLAYRLEFFLLHPTFVTLFNFLKCIPGEKSPVDGYEDHLKFFIDGMVRFGGKSPELELLAETINHLWTENSKLVRQSSTDELTGVLNRRGLFNAIKPMAYLAQRSGLEVCVIIFDIDDFKNVNDNFGHQKGDKVIAEVASVLSKNLRHSDVIGRYGGEEFMIFLTDSGKGMVEKLAEKLRKAVGEHQLEGVSVTISVGAACGHLEQDVEKELDQLIGRADANLYKAKERGKNRVQMDE